MLRRECSLCGGKLRGNICTECGLDNSKSDDNYKTAQSHSDFENLTHIHERFDPFAGKTMTKEQKKEMKNRIAAKQTKNVSYQYAGNASQFGNRKNRKGAPILIVTLIPIIVALIGGIGALSYLMVGSEEMEPRPEYEYVDEYDPYEFVEYDLPETGDLVEESFSAGEYIGGVHIPEGTYSVTLVEGYGNYNVVSEEHGIYIYESFDEDQYGETLTYDLRIYEGAKFTVSESAILLLHSENALSDLQFIENPNTKSFTMGGDFVVGDEVMPGVYDVYGIKGAGLIDFVVEFEDGYESYGSVLVGEEGNEFFYPAVYKNLVLPEGVEVQMEDMIVELVPSEVIRDEEYLEYYR